MSVPSPVEELSTADRETLEAAHRRLREAVAGYEEFLGRELRPGQDAPAHSAQRVAAAQARIEEAESDLWRLREALLGWARPPWAPRASAVTDWFSDEDRSYDELDPGSAG